MSSEIARAPQASPSATPHDREMWIDLARGLGVILVVFGHMLIGLVGERLFPPGAVADWLTYVVYTFHMPLFFYLSALNVRASLRRGPRAFLVTKGWTIVYPYVLWSLLQGGSIMLIGGDANAPVTASMLVMIWYRPIAQFWFLYALMICHILAVIIPDRRALLAVAVLGLAVFEWRMDQPGLALVLHDLPAYAFGLYPLSRKGARPAIAWLVVVWLGFAVSVMLGGLARLDPQSLASLPACITGIAGVVLLCKYLECLDWHWLAAVGTMSMTIYVMHIFAGAGTRIILGKLHIDMGSWGYLSVCTAVGVVIPMIAHVVLRRLYLLAPLGLASFRSARQRAEHDRARLSRSLSTVR